MTEKKMNCMKVFYYIVKKDTYSCMIHNLQWSKSCRTFHVMYFECGKWGRPAPSSMPCPLHHFTLDPWSTAKAILAWTHHFRMRPPISVPLCHPGASLETFWPKTPSAQGVNKLCLSSTAAEYVLFFYCSVEYIMASTVWLA